MLAHLSIRNIVLIESLDIEFDDGLTVLTGETGAGKSIMLDSLSLALGARGDGGLVRAGESQGHVAASFDVAMDHPVRAFLFENDIDADGEIILKRRQNADGRTRGTINDSPASAGLMRRVGELLVEIHGQHDDRALVDPEAHRELLDAHGGLAKAVADVRSAHSDLSRLETELRRLRARMEEAEREGDYLRSAVEELSALAPQDGEEDELADQRQSMMRFEKIASDLAEADEALSGQASPMPVLSSLARLLERKVEDHPGLLDETVEALGRALDAISDAQAGVENAIRATEFDPKELERAEERLFALRAASRKFKVPVTELPALAIRLAGDLGDLDAGGERLVALEKALDAARATYDEKARRLASERGKAAGKLTKAVMRELPDLKLERAEFIVRHDSDPEARTADGIDTIEFWVRTNPGTKPGPMMKVASGGELSRFLLALKVALAERGSAPTLVFDEIDTGVGGAVADAIGKRLARLAETVQVLSVTHAPQVAARAGVHMLISKGSANGGNVLQTRIRPMDAGDRREEIARMLAGASVTDEARAAAARLLDGR